MTERRPADIAADLRANWGMPRRIVLLADELDALDARWPTADEVAELRDTAKALPTRHARRINAFLDRLDPPAPEPQAADDVDWRALSVALVDAAAAKDYKAFAAVANRVRAARAALDARRQA